VKIGTAQRGKGRGRPYVFLNFGDWRGDSVRITIWSEGLASLATPPDNSWEGKWISVTGLVEPMYQKRGQANRSVGITVGPGDQIVTLSEAKAMFRLGVAKPARRGRSTGQTKNQQVVEDAKGATMHGTPTQIPPLVVRPTPAPRAPKPLVTPNQAVVQAAKAAQAPGRPSSPRPQPTTSQPVQTKSDSWGWMLWLVIVGIPLLGLISRCSNS
jgi:hypothetical protein